MAYRCEATSVAGFVQQLAVGYIAHGYYFYVRGHIPDHKDPAATDHKIIAQYAIDLSKWSRSRRKKGGGGQRAIPALRSVLRHPRHARRTSLLRRRSEAGAGLPQMPPLLHGLFHWLPARARGRSPPRLGADAEGVAARVASAISAARRAVVCGASRPRAAGAALRTLCPGARPGAGHPPGRQPTAQDRRVGTPAAGCLVVAAGAGEAFRGVLHRRNRSFQKEVCSESALAVVGI